MALVIVESPNKISKIQQILGDDYTVIASVGHIMDLSKSDMGIDRSNWEPVYVDNKDKKNVIRRIKSESAIHNDIYIATDDDNEGSAIAHNILSLIEDKNKNIYRSIFKTITKKDVLKGIRTPVGFNENTYNAQKVRRITDRLVGFGVSPVMWSKGLKGTSAGRVQSAGLKIIADRERAISSFVKEEFWTIHLDVDLGFELNLKSKSKMINAEAAEEIINSIGPSVEITICRKTRTKSNPPSPFETSSLQQVAGTRFGWSGKKVMEVAQSLFGEGLITYHRTDSLRSDPDKIEYVRKLILKKYGGKYLPSKPFKYGPAKGAQDAHECIRPTFELIPFGMDNDDIKLLELISDRYMASQMSCAEFDKVSIAFQCNKSNLIFTAIGSALAFDGFSKLVGKAAKDKKIPELEVGLKFDVKSKIKTIHHTKPPKRLSEASFTNKLKKEGIGRPSTYASIVEALVGKLYVSRNNNNLYATEIGFVVCDYLDSFFPRLTDPKFTSEMESKLDKLASGDLDKYKVLSVFNKTLNTDIESAITADTGKLFETDRVCPKCNDNSHLKKKVSSVGLYFGCENYPKCGYIVIDDGSDGGLISEVETGSPCPECSSILIDRESKYGKYISCSGYPVCTWKGERGVDGKIIELKSKSSVESRTNLDCQLCGVGKIVIIDGKFGKYASCDRYPKCKAKHSMSGNKINRKLITQGVVSTESCPKCKEGFLTEKSGKFGSFTGCSRYSKGCNYISK